MVVQRAVELAEHDRLFGGLAAALRGVGGIVETDAKDLARIFDDIAEAHLAFRDQAVGGRARRAVGQQQAQGLQVAAAGNHIDGLGRQTDLAIALHCGDVQHAARRRRTQAQATGRDDIGDVDAFEGTLVGGPAWRRLLRLGLRSGGQHGLLRRRAPHLDHAAAVLIHCFPL